MKSNRTRLLILLSLPLLCLIAMMAKTDLAPLTFRPNSAPKQFQAQSSTDPLTIDKVPYRDLMRMVAKYRDERQGVINTHFSGTATGQYGDNFEDARYFYISLESLERYIAFVKQQIAANQVNVEFSGIRIYPIVYPNSGSSSYYSSIPSVYRNHSSIVFTPTYMDQSGYAIDFDPDLYSANPGGSGNIPKNLEMLDTQSVASFMTATFGSTSGGDLLSAQDHIWLCPPPKPCPHGAALINADLICPDHNSCQY